MTYRNISTAIWTDDNILSMSPEQKLIFLYLHTSPYTSACGIFKLQPKTMGFQIGITSAPLESSLRGLCAAFPDFVAVDWHTMEVALLQYPRQLLITANARTLAICTKDIQNVQSQYLLRELIKRNSAGLGAPYLAHLRRLQMQEINSHSANVLLDGDLLISVENQQIIPEIEIEIEIERDIVVFDENDHTPFITKIANQRPNETPADLIAPAGVSKSTKKKAVQETADQVREIIAHLNTATGSEFRANTKATVQAINARLEEGYTIADFKEVIDVKAAQWKGDDKMQGYLRPETLFRPSHFEAYLQEAKRGIINSSTSTDASHVKFLQYIEKNYPALWKSSCRVFSLQEFQDYTNNTSLPGLSYHMTPDQRRAALMLLLKELNESEKRRREVGNLFTGYLNHMRQALKNR